METSVKWIQVNIEMHRQRMAFKCSHFLTVGDDNSVCEVNTVVFGFEPF